MTDPENKVGCEKNESGGMEMERFFQLLAAGKETIIEGVRIVSDDVGYHLSNGDEKVTVHWISHIPEALKKLG